MSRPMKNIYLGQKKRNSKKIMKKYHKDTMLKSFPFTVFSAITNVDSLLLLTCYMHFPQYGHEPLLSPHLLVNIYAWVLHHH